MVPRTRGDDDHRQVVVHGDVGHGTQGSVTAGRHQQVRPAVEGRGQHSAEVITGFDDMVVDLALGGDRDDRVLGTSPARASVHQEERMHEANANGLRDRSAGSAAT